MVTIKEWLWDIFTQRERITAGELSQLCRQQFGNYKWTEEWCKVRGWKAAIAKLYYLGYIRVDVSSFGEIREDTVVYLNILPEPIPNVTFGIEFEGNIISKSGEMIRTSTQRYYTLPGSHWSWQGDGTVTFEHRSPVWNNVVEAFTSTTKQYSAWVEANEGLAPYFRPNEYYSKVGGHIHIGFGKPSALTPKRAIEVVRIIYPYLAFLYYINANGVRENTLSLRMALEPYSSWLRNPDYITAGRYEITFNEEHNTLEFRMFDGNVPPIQLAVAFLLREVVQRSRQLPLRQFCREEGRMLLYYPPPMLALLEARDRFKDVSDVDVSNLPLPVKEVLTLAFVFLLNPAKFVGSYSYQFSLETAVKGTFLDAIEWKGEKKKIAEKAKEIAKSARKLADLLRRIVLTKEVYSIMLQQRILVEELRTMGYEVEFITPQVAKEAAKEAAKATAERMATGWYRIREVRLSTLIELSNWVRISVPNIRNMRPRWYLYLHNGELAAYVVVEWAERRITMKGWRTEEGEKATREFIAHLKKKEGCVECVESEQ